ncbi:MAG: hypothetical protein MJ096_02265 [Clostridia bacterium]|nr:hypothetical protein [Clostridia bacterium]
MKKTFLILSVILLVSLPVRAETYEFESGKSSEYYPEAEMKALFDALPEDVAGELGEFSSASDNSERTEALSEKFSVKGFFGYVVKTVRETVFPTVSGIVGMLGVTLLSSSILMLMELRESEKTKKISSFAFTLITALPTAGAAVSAVRCCEAYVARICTVMNAMFPVMTAVGVMNGSTGAASVGRMSLMLYVTVTENLTRIILVPAAGALLALGTVSCAFPEVKLVGFISFAKKTVIRVLTLSTVIFSFVLGVQTSLAKSADTLAARTVRFAVGSSVPIVGSALSDAISAVGAGLSAVRHTAGAVGILIVLLIVTPTLVTLAVYRLAFAACGGIAELLGNVAGATLIREADSVVAVFFALASLSAVLFVFAAVLFMNSGVA